VGGTACVPSQEVTSRNFPPDPATQTEFEHIITIWTPFINWAASPTNSLAKI